MKLTIGMPSYDNYQEVWFTVQALRMYQDLEDCEILVIDNYGKDVRITGNTFYQNGDGDSDHYIADAISETVVLENNKYLKWDKDRLKKEADTASKEQETVEQNIAQRTPVISPKARTWAQDNSWFGQDRVLTSAAMGLHDELLSQGFDVESDDYYNEINKRMKDYFPSKFANAEETVRKENSNNRPVQAVAGVSRKQGGRRTVTLTKSQVAIAKKLGVPLEEYAKFVKEER